MQILLCPKCHIALGESDVSNNLDAVCGHCEYHYQILKARLVGSTQTSWGYRLQLEYGAGRKHTVQYWFGTIHAWAQRRMGEWVGLLVTVRENVIEDVISVWASNDPGVHLHYPGRRARSIAARGSLVAFVLVLVIGGFSLPATVSGLLAGSAAYWGIGKLRASRARLSDDRWRETRAIQALLQRKLEFGRAALRARNEASRKTDLAEQVSHLIDNMGSVDEVLYSGRIERLNRAALLLVNQSDRQLRLAEGYVRAMRKVDIEIQSRKAARLLGQELPETVAPDEGLQVLEEEIRRLDMELAANEEVEQLLAQSTPSDSEAQMSGDEIPPIPLERLFDDLHERRDWDQLG